MPHRDAALSVISHNASTDVAMIATPISSPRLETQDPGPACGTSTGQALQPLFRRLPRNPIITPAMLNDTLPNVNGPSLIRAPEWLPDRRATYYLYFAHHRGGAVRLAYADDLSGPWSIFSPGALTVEAAAAANSVAVDSKSHIASPDVWVDEARHKIRLYFHVKLPGLGQISCVAESSDGIDFEVIPGALGRPYLRHFCHQGHFYFIDRAGYWLRSRDGVHDFEPGPDTLAQAFRQEATGAVLRHVGVRLQDGHLQIAFSRIGDAPESIWLSTVKLDSDWRQWRPTAPVKLLESATDYEGAQYPAIPSAKGAIFKPVHQLRDPCFYDEDGHTYLIYAVAGENGLAIGECFGLKLA